MIVPSWGFLRGVRPPFYKYERAIQVARTLLEYPDISKNPSEAFEAHRKIAQVIEARAATLKIFVRRDPMNPFGPVAGIIRQHGVQLRMQGLIEDYQESGTISPTELCERLGNGLLREDDYWSESLFKLSFGRPRFTFNQWNPKHLSGAQDDFCFPLVERILELASRLPSGGIRFQEVLCGYKGHEDSDADAAVKRIKKKGSKVDKFAYKDDERRGLREILNLMAEYSPKDLGAAPYGAKWLTHQGGSYYITPAGESLITP